MLAESGDGLIRDSLDDEKTWRKWGYLTGQVLAATFFENRWGQA